MSEAQNAPASTPEPTAPPSANEYTVRILAETIWGEARGDGAPGMEAVASVALNRAKHPRWWGIDIVSVCLMPYQFSCRNKNDPNLPKLLAVTEADPSFALALQIAERAVAGTLADPTHGADSYYDTSMHTPPAWAAHATHTVDVGTQRFYRVELPAP